MSADNWGLCPRCYNEAEKTKQKMRTKAANAYGKAKPEEYITMRDAAEAEIALDSTLREDYEIGTDESGVFDVSYRASCHVCKLSFEFKHTEVVSLTTKRATKS